MKHEVSFSKKKSIEMDRDKPHQSKELLRLINNLYDENTRHEALKELSERKSEVKLRALCIFNSFGILTILQQEIISAYKYLTYLDMPEEFEIRLCNALTILRSITSYSDIATSVMNAHILWFLGPLVRATNPRFTNIRKVSLTVFVEVTGGTKGPEVSRIFVEDGILNVCLLVFDKVGPNEKNGIMLILINVLSEKSLLGLINMNMMKSFLILCGMEAKQPQNEKSALRSYWERVIRYFYENGYEEMVRAIQETIRMNLEGQ